MRVAETTANPTARSMARYALGLVLKKSEPDRALALFDEAAELAASVQNFWWYGIALMEAAATRAVHGDPAQAARMFIEVLDHWDRVGDWTQQWLNLRYVTRLLVRLGADDDAVVLHHALVEAGKPSPLGAALLADLADRLGEDRFDALSGSAAAPKRLFGLVRPWDGTANAPRQACPVRAARTAGPAGRSTRWWPRRDRRSADQRRDVLKRGIGPRIGWAMAWPA